MTCSDIWTITKICRRNFHFRSLPLSLLLHCKKICFLQHQRCLGLPPSTFCGLSPMHYYQLTMPHEGSDNPSHDSPPPPPPPTEPEPQPQRPRKQRRRPHVTHLHINSFCFFCLTKTIIFNIYVNYLFCLFYIYHTLNLITFTS